MILLVTPDPDTVTIEESDNPASPAVTARPELSSRLNGVLCAHRSRSFDGEHAWLEIGLIRGVAPATDHSWHENFASMIPCAATGGRCRPTNALLVPTAPNHTDIEPVSAQPTKRRRQSWKR